MTPLLLLAEKVEGLENRDVRVDRQIANALGIGSMFISGSPSWRFTAYVDAAMALVPEGCDYDVGRYDEALCCARVWRRGFMHDAETWCAATPALALVAASLRARAAMEAGE